MKIIEISKDRNQIFKLLRALLDSNIELCLWQKIKGKRIQYQFKLSNIVKEPESLSFIQSSGKDVAFKEGEVFVYCEDKGFIYTSEVIAIGKTKTSLSTPLFLILLNENEMNMIRENRHGPLIEAFKKLKIPNNQKDIMKTKRSLSEEEKYLHVREAPRGKTNEEKTVELAVVGESNSLFKYTLFDLSKGGMAICSKFKGDFEVDRKVQVSRIGDDKLNPPINGIIRSINQMQQKSQLFKIGIQFIEE